MKKFFEILNKAELAITMTCVVGVHIRADAGSCGTPAGTSAELV